MLDRLKLWWLSWKLNSDNLTTRVDAVQQLQNMEGPRVKETLVGALAALVPKLKHIEAGSRADVVKALWSIGDERVREALRGWLNTGDWSVAAVEVLRVLWTSEDTEARKMVTASLYHGSPILRRMTARALEKLKDPSAVGVLTVALETTYARLQSLDDLETLQAIAEALDTLEWTPITDAHRNVLRDIAIGVVPRTAAGPVEHPP
jgi:HEAT repeat protein